MPSMKTSEPGSSSGGDHRQFRASWDRSGFGLGQTPRPPFYAMRFIRGDSRADGSLAASTPTWDPGGGCYTGRDLCGGDDRGVVCSAGSFPIAASAWGRSPRRSTLVSTRWRRFTEPQTISKRSHPPAPSMINFDGRICQRSGKIPTPGLSSQMPSSPQTRAWSLPRQMDHSGRNRGSELWFEIGRMRLTAGSRANSTSFRSPMDRGTAQYLWRIRRKTCCTRRIRRMHK